MELGLFPMVEAAARMSIPGILAIQESYPEPLFASVFSVLSRRSLGCVEMQCYATGEDFCKFVVSDYDRVNAAAFWRGEGATAKDIMKKLHAM